MRNPRKVIAQALLKQLQTNLLAAGVLTADSLVTRSGRMETNINPGDMPALVLYHPAERGEGSQFGMETWRMHFVAVLVTRVDPALNASVPPDDFICDLIDAIDTSMDGQKSGDLTGKVSLGGLVTNAWIDGTIEIDGGIIDQPVVIQIPITVLDGQ